MLLKKKLNKIEGSKVHVFDVYFFTGCTTKKQPQNHTKRLGGGGGGGAYESP